MQLDMVLRRQPAAPVAVAAVAVGCEAAVVRDAVRGVVALEEVGGEGAALAGGEGGEVALERSGEG